MSDLATLGALAEAQRLWVSGVVRLTAADGLGPDWQSAVLLSPDGRAFWPHFQTSAEARDAAADPLDRWSARVIGQMARRCNGLALFPFGGPPHHPFHAWALRSGRAWASPLRLLVQERDGLFASYRGAIVLRAALPVQPASAPCRGCAQPCLSACPVSAFSDSGYDLAACHSHLDSGAEQDCMGQGCKARRACPVGADRRDPAQSAFHMKAFHPS